MNMAQRPDHVPAGLVVPFDMYAQAEISRGFHGAWMSLLSPVIPSVVWTPCNEGHWIVTRPEIFPEVYENTDLFSSNTIIIPKSHGDAHDLIPTTMDPPEHQPYRLILNKLLAPAMISRISASVRDATHLLLDTIEPQGQCDFTTAFAQQLPLHVFLSLMDLPVEDLDKIKYWSDQTTHPDGSMSFADALAHLYDYLEPYIIQRRENPGEDFISKLVNAEVDGRRVDDSEARRLTIQLLIAGVDTVVNFLNFLFLKLARDAELQRECVDLVDIDRLIEDLLADLPLVTVGRLVKADCEFHGAPLKAGDMIALPTPLAAGYRQEITKPNSNSHLTFGQGVHMCPGRHLARMEIGVVIEAWFSRIPAFTLAPDTVVSFTGGIVGTIPKLELCWGQ